MWCVAAWPTQLWQDNAQECNRWGRDFEQELGVPFIVVLVPLIVSEMLGKSEKTLRKAFKAKVHTFCPCRELNHCYVCLVVITTCATMCTSLSLWHAPCHCHRVRHRCHCHRMHLGIIAMCSPRHCHCMFASLLSSLPHSPQHHHHVFTSALLPCAPWCHRCVFASASSPCVHPASSPHICLSIVAMCLP